MDITKTASYKNIKKSFEGESQALLKYLIYADLAREEGHLDIARLFEKMAKNEREHAKIWYKILNDGFDTTEKNLQNAASGENDEWKQMYPSFSKQARKEGLDTVAIMFERIASIEADHERQFYEAYARLTNKAEPPTPKTNSVKEYYCLFCGHCGDSPLPVCPVCGAKDSFAE